MRMKKKSLLTLLLLLFAFPIYASAATFEIFPKEGSVELTDEFYVDILIDSEGAQVNKASAVLTFDPTYLEIISAERNNALFDQFPADMQTTDNDNGVIMLTGFTQSGGDFDLYQTDGDPDVFARIQFKSQRPGRFTLDWEYNGEDLPFKTVILADGSPPSVVLDSAPAFASFTSLDDDNDGTGNFQGEVVPVTAAGDYIFGYIGVGLVFVGAMIYRLFDPIRSLLLDKRSGTVVITKDE